VTTNDPETVRRLLERDLVEWAEDTSLRLVWADLLLIDGDPLGRLVMLDHAGTQRSPEAERARAEAEGLRQELAPRLWSPDMPQLQGIELHWQLGFVREVDIVVAKLPKPEAPPRRGRRQRAEIPTTQQFNERTFARLLRQSALRWVEVVRIEAPDEHASLWLSWAYSSSSATLREIHIGSPPKARTRPSGTWEVGGNNAGVTPWGIDNLVRSYPRLRWVSIGGELQRLPTRDGNAQSRVHHVRKLATRPLTSPNRASLARAFWDASSIVQEAAHATARELRAEAEFLIEDLAWFLRPPLGKKDPRPIQAFATLAKIGAASAVLLPEVMRNQAALIETHERREALLRWLAALGPLARPARSIVDVVFSQPSLPKPVREAAKSARKALGDM
jgi:hypothetical protein